MLLVEADEQGIDTICLTDLTDEEVREMYAESIDDYEASMTPAYAGYGDYQQMCAEAVVLVADEAKRRGLLLRTMH